MYEFSKIMEQIQRRERELHERREQLKGLVVDITEVEREKIVKKAGRDFFYFAKKVFPEYCTKPFSVLHKDIHDQYLLRKREVHIVAAPPEHGKTSILRLLKIWGAIYGKKNYQIKVTETMELSKIDLASIKLEFEENPRINFLYGNLKTEGKWDAEACRVTPTRWNRYGCWFEAFAYGVPPTGRLREQFRPDFCDIDDLENYRKSGNVNISKDKIQFINNDIIPRMSLDAPIIWFGNNARKTMAINIMIEMDEERRKIEYPAFRIHVYPAFSRIKNRPLWHEAYQFDDEEKMRLFFGVGLMTWLGNYMQSPVVPDGAEFKKIHWREYRSLPSDALGIMFCDPASGKSGCFKAATVMLFSRQTMKFHVPAIFCRQCDWEPYFQWMYDIYTSKLQGHIRFIGWEKDFYQEQFILFRRLYPKLKDKPELPVRPTAVRLKGKDKNKPMQMPSGGPKDERIRSVAVPYEMGQIAFHEDILLNSEGVEAQNQLIGFPDYPYKDWPDSFSSAYREVFNMFAGYISPTIEGAEVYESVQSTRVNRESF